MTALVCGGGLAGAAGIEPETPPTNYGGDFRLFMAGTYVGKLHSFSGCSTELREGDANATVRTETACVFEVGSSVTPAFRALITDMAVGNEAGAYQDFVIGPTAASTKGSVVNNELRFRASIAEITLPSTQPGGTSAPAWMEVRLRPHPKTRVQRWTTGGTTVPRPVDAPFETSRTQITLGNGLSGYAGTDPIKIRREYLPDPPATTENDFTGPGRIVGEPVLRMPDGALANDAATWFNDRAAKNITTNRLLHISYPGTTVNSSIDVRLQVRPFSFDPFARTDGLRRLRLTPRSSAANGAIPAVEDMTWTGVKG